MSNRFWILVFITAILFDCGIIIYPACVKNLILLYIMVIAALAGAYLLFNSWNKDERTDQAIDDASRDVIKIFLFVIVTTGTIFIILNSFNDSILWEIGATLLVSAILLIYFHAIISVYYES